MSTIGEQLLISGRPDVGVGVQIDPTKLPDGYLEAIYKEFGCGLVLSQSQENAPQEAATFMLDMEVDRADRIIRAPGLTLVEDANPRNLRWAFEQASLDFATELVIVDPPYFGFKGSTTFTFINAGIAATPSTTPGWGGAVAAGTLIFSNGLDHTYARQPGAMVVTDISASVIARVFGVAFGRIFAGYYMSGVNPQSLGLKWNAASGAYNDWSGTGSGAELLLSDVGESDKIVALTPVGLDVLGIFNRKSIWVGYPTGDYLRPAEPRLRVGGLGAVSAETVKVCHGGVAFLSDEGVGFFDLTNASIISHDINAELLPLDYTRITQYTAAYSPQLMRYYLCTPFCTWIYEFPIPGTRRKGRWFKRSLIANNVIVWSEQSGGLWWDQAIGNWDAQVGSWDTQALQASAAPGRVHFMLGTKLSREDRSSLSNLGTPIGPVWQTPQHADHEITAQFTTFGFEVEYKSFADAQLRLAATDLNGDPGPTVTKTLPSSGGKTRRYVIWNQSTGMGVKAQVEILSGDPAISRIRQLILPSGPSLVSL